MQAVMHLAEHVWVLAQGRLIAEGTPGAGHVATSKVVEAYLGHGTGGAAAPGPHPGGASQCEPQLLDIQGLRGGYGRVEVLRGVDLHVSAGEMVALLGSNGAGKSTLNKMVCGLCPAWGGTVRFDGQGPERRPLPRGGEGRPDPGARRPQGVPQPERAARTWNSAPSRRARERRAAQPGARVPHLPAAASERRAQRAGTMSGGEQQMLAIGRGLMAEPVLLILDEPSLGLSPLLVEEMFSLIRQLRGDGLAVLLVEQNVGQSLEIADRAYVLENGSVRFSGLPGALLGSDELRRAYLGL